MLGYLPTKAKEMIRITGKIVKTIAIFLIALFICAPIASAASVGAYKVKRTEDYVSSIAKCSCGKGNYHYNKATFKNYCPNCNHKGTLYYEVGAYYGYNRGTSPEGLWYCSRCDMDFCCQCGKSHDGRGFWLIRTKMPKPIHKVNKTSTPHKTEPTVVLNLHGKDILLKKSFVQQLLAAI